MNELVKLFVRPAVWLVVIIALAASLFYLGVRHIRSLVDEAAKSAKQECDSHWQAEISQANAAAARKLAEQHRAALAAETLAQDEIRTLTEQLEDMEDSNAALPDNTCGIDRERVRLLDRQTAGNR